MTTITPEQVWEAFLKDDVSTGQFDVVLAAIRPNIEALPVILADVLDVPVTLKVISEAKATFLSYCLEHSFIGTMGKNLATYSQAAMSANIQMLQTTSADVPGYLRKFGMSESEYMLHDVVGIGLNDENRLLYQEGKLTIAQLLLTQPSMFANYGE